jgi:type II secretory pathway pseudopilin PulG
LIYFVSDYFPCRIQTIIYINKKNIPMRKLMKTPTVLKYPRLPPTKLFTLASGKSGMSIIEVLIAAAIMSVIGAAVTTLITSQQKETRALTEKLVQLDLQKLLISSLANGSICTSELASNTFDIKAPYKIDSTKLAEQKLILNSIHASTNAGAPTLVATNKAVSALTSHLLVSKISFDNFVSTGIPDNYLADLKIAFSGGVRSISPILMKMSISTKPTDPPTAKTITNCLDSNGIGKSYRFVFTSTQTWQVPPGVKNAFISMAGGGGSGFGWRVQNAVFTGHSGGYVFSHPVNLIPGEIMTVEVGTGAASYAPVKTGALAKPGSPFYVFNSPSGDDGLGGYPGTASKLISPTMGTLLECDGGSGASIKGIDNFGGPMVAGNKPGAMVGSGNPPIKAPNRGAAGPYATLGGPGACGPNKYGLGNTGVELWGMSSGNYLGGTTPFGYGTGGGLNRSGCYVSSTVLGTCNAPTNGRDGVVFIDIW